MAEDFGSISIDAPNGSVKKQTNDKQRERRRNAQQEKSTPKKEPKSPLQEPEDPQKKDIKNEEQIKKESDKNTSRAPRTRRKKPTQNGRGALFYGGCFLGSTLVLSSVLYLAAGFIGAPYLVQTRVQEIASTYENLDIKMEKVRFNPFSMGISITDVELTNPQAEQPLLAQIPHITATLLPRYLFDKEIILEHVRLDTPKISLSRDADGTNFGNIFSETSDNPLAAVKNKSLPIAINGLEVVDGTFNLDDKIAHQSHKAYDINLYYPSFGTVPAAIKSTELPAFSAVINGSPVAFSHIDGASKDSKLSFEMQDMDLGLYLGYLPLSIPLDLTKGRGTGIFELYFSKDEAGKDLITLGIGIEGKDATFAHKTQKASLHIEELKAKASYQFLNKALSIDSLKLIKPTFRLKDTERLENIASLLPEKLSKGEKSPLSVTELVLEDGRIGLDSSDTFQFDEVEFALSSYSNTQGAQAAGFSFGFHNIADKSKISWNGHLKDGQAEGEVTVVNVPIERLYQNMNIASNGKNTGRATIEGPLTIYQNKEKQAFESSLDNGRISIADLSLYFNNSKWLYAPKLSFEGVSLSPEKNILGNLQVENAKIKLNGDSLPPMLTRLGDQSYSVASLHFTGAATLERKGYPTLRAKKISIEADKLNEAQLTADNIKIVAELDHNAKVMAEGRAKISPLSLWLGTEFKNLNSQTVLPWFSRQSIFEQSTATFSGKGRLILPHTSFKGSLESGATTVKKDGKVLTKWQAMTVNDFDYIAGEKSLSIADIAITAPQLSWERKERHPALYSKGRTVLLGLLQGYGINKNAPFKSIKIRKLTIKNGSLSINDNRFATPWKGVITGLSGSVEAIDSSMKDNPIVFNYSGSYKKSGIRLQGNSVLFSPHPSHEITLSIKNFAPKNFARQLTNLSDKIALPDLLDIKIYQKSNKSEVNTVTDLIFTKTKPRTEKEALVLALLKGTKEYPEISLLTKSNQPERDEALVTDIEKQLNKILVKAEISPLLFAAPQYTSLIEASKIEFRFGEFTLPAGETQQLLLLKDFLNAYPDVAIRIKGEASPVVDGDAIRKVLEEKERERINQENSVRLAEWNKDGANKVQEGEDGFVEENIFIPLQPQAVKVTQQMLLELANKRAQIIYNVFTNQLGLDKNRIIVEKTTSLAQDAGSVARFSFIARP